MPECQGQGLISHNALQTEPGQRKFYSLRRKLLASRKKYLFRGPSEIYTFIIYGI